MNPILHVLKNKTPLATPPVWLMRQAGRYLPEYLATRAQAGGFMEAVLNPPLATEITLQPLRRFAYLDAAILFSDILVIPYALGQDVAFVKGEGPQLPALDAVDCGLVFDPGRLQPMMQTLRNVRAALPPEKAVIGFAGSPWTVACYMIAGANVHDFLAAKRWVFTNDSRFDALMETLISATTDYLSAQITAGADVVQLFDSWAGALVGHPASFERAVIAPTKKIVSALKARHPDTPIIGFPRGAGVLLPEYAAATGIDAVGLDWAVDPVWAHKTLPVTLPIQGNLDPHLVVAGGAAMRDHVAHLKRIWSDRPWIFNLGHGLVPQTPPQHVMDVLEQVKNKV